MKKEFTDERIIQSLEGHGCSWRDYILVDPGPIVCRFPVGSELSALVIEDNDLKRATVEFLRRRGARSFASFDDVKRGGHGKTQRNG